MRCYRFYLTYEGLKLFQNTMQHRLFSIVYILPNKELKLSSKVRILGQRKNRSYLIYEESKLYQSTLFGYLLKNRSTQKPADFQRVLSLA